MRIQYFEAKDFCGFESIRCDFDPGLNLLVGPNGSGKSSILEGLNILFYASSASRSQYVRVGASSALLRAEFVLDDVPYLCKRTISRSGSSAEIINLKTGQPVCYGVGAVKSFFDAAFNLEGRGFSWYLKQGAIPSFLSIFANYDMDKIFSLFGIGTLKNFSSYFNVTLKTIFGDAQADYSHADYLCTNLQAKIAEQEAQLVALREQGAEYAALKEECQQAERELRRLEEQKKFAEIQRYYANLVKSAEEIDSTIKSVEAELDALRQELKTYLFQDAQEITEELLSSSLFDLNQRLSQIAKQKAEYAKYLEVSSQISRILARFRDRPAPVSSLLAHTRELYQDVKSRLAIYQKNDPRVQLEHYISHNLTGKCPLCEQEIPLEQLKRFAQDCAFLEDQAQRLANSIQNLQTQRDQRAELRSALRRLRDAHRRVRGMAQYSEDLEKELIQVKDYLTRTLAKFKELTEELLRLNGKRTSIASSISQIKELPDVTYPGDEVYALAKLRHSELSQRLAQLEKAAMQIKATETHLEWLKNSLAEAEAARAKYKKNSDIFNICTNLCKEFVEDVQQYICNLLSEGGFLSIVNRILADVDAVYRVSFEFNGETYDFIAHFPDGTNISVTRLSYGQQVILAFILLFVFYLMTCSTGVLLVDEPTAGLDSRHLNGISTILDTMNTLCQQQSVQCIMATHEADILRGDYKIISIEKEAHT